MARWAIEHNHVSFLFPHEEPSHERQRMRAGLSRDGKVRSTAVLRKLRRGFSERNIKIPNFLFNMIAGIDHQADITLYLEAEEVDKLGREKLEGVLVKTRKPKRQGTIYISVNDARKNENGCGIGIDDKGYWGVQDGFRVEVFMGTEWYQELRERGKIGLRQRMLDGSKVNIYDRSKLDGIDAMGAENLEFYRDNKERLPADFE